MNIYRTVFRHQAFRNGGLSIAFGEVISNTLIRESSFCK